MIIIVIIIIKSSLKFKKGNALSSESKNTTIQYHVNYTSKCRKGMTLLIERIRDFLVQYVTEKIWREFPYF